MHGEDLSSMFKTVPQSVLPADYGGKAASCKELHGKLDSLARIPTGLQTFDILIFCELISSIFPSFYQRRT